MELEARSPCHAEPVVLDLFCGAGGMSLGFEMANYRIGMGVDDDPVACRTHAHNFQGHCVQADITAIADPGDFVHAHGLERVDVIVGGPPCQGFSRVGRGKLRQVNNDPTYIHDPRNRLHQEFIRFVAALHPLWFVMENVSDMQNYHDGTERLIDKMKREFDFLGYDSVPLILLAADYGVPQTRQRLFILGNRTAQEITKPEPTHGKGHEYPYVSVWDAIGDLPVRGIGDREDEIIYAPRCELNEYQQSMRDGADGVLYNHQTRWHRPDDIRAFTLLSEGGRYVDLPDELRRYDSKSHPEERNSWFKDRYRKLIRLEPSWTVEAHIGKDTYRHIYPSQEGEPEPPRTISVREAARLQSFPDRFRFLGAFTNQFHQVGNAVPPLLAKAIAQHIRSQVMVGIEKEQHLVQTGA